MTGQENLHFREDTYTTIERAIKTSITLSVERYLQRYPQLRGESPDTLIKDAVYNKCSESSIDTLLLLAFNHPTRFRYLLLLGSAEQRIWNKHYIFLAQDQELKWFAGAPSEIPRRWHSGPFQKYQLALNEFVLPGIMEAGSIPELLGEIRKTQPGFWPTADAIQHLLQKSSLQLPEQIADTLLVQVPEIHYSYEDTRHYTVDVSILPDMIPYLSTLALPMGANYHRDFED